MLTKTLIALLFAAAAACTSSPNYHVNYAPQSGTTTASKPDSVQRAVIAITDAGREVESSDASTGIVLTKWFRGDGVAADQNRYRIRVVLSDTTYQVAALCQVKGAFSGAWEDCSGQDKMPRFVVELVDKIAGSLK